MTTTPATVKVDVVFDYTPADIDAAYAEEIVRLNAELARHKAMLHSAARQIVALTTQPAPPAPAKKATPTRRNR